MLSSIVGWYGRVGKRVWRCLLDAFVEVVCSNPALWLNVLLSLYYKAYCIIKLLFTTRDMMIMAVSPLRFCALLHD